MDALSLNMIIGGCHVLWRVVAALSCTLHVLTGTVLRKAGHADPMPRHFARRISHVAILDRQSDSQILRRGVDQILSSGGVDQILSIGVGTHSR